MPALPNPRVLKRAGGHIASFGSGMVFLGGLQANGISIEQITSLINSFGDLATKIVTAVGAATVLYTTIRSGQQATDSAVISDTTQIAANPSSISSPEAQKQLAQAVKSIVESPEIPVTFAAKSAVLDAAAGLDEVRGKIQVTDAALVNSTISDQVVLAK